MWYEIEHRRPQREKGPSRAILFNYLPKQTIGAEVGVWAGEFSQQLLEFAQPTRLHLIDTWMFRPEREASNVIAGGDLARSQRDMDQLYALVTAKYRDDPRVQIHRCSSAEAALVIPDNSLNWVYIDANHEYPSVAHDLRTWSCKLISGGLIAGDDYGVADSGGRLDGVTKAVDEFIAQTRCEVLSLAAYQYVLRLPESN